MPATDWIDASAAGLISGYAAQAPWVLLAGCRWFGLLWGAPLLGAAVPIRLRVALSLLMGVLVLPVAAGGQTAISLVDLMRPAGLLDFAGAAANELVVGLVLGFGMRIVFSGLLLAGELIDQQAGLALTQTFRPAFQAEATTTGHLLGWTGVACLVFSPVGGAFPLVSTLLELFEVLPLGTGAAGSATGHSLIVLVQQSVILAVHVAAPLLAVMSLVTLGVGWLGRSLPQFPTGPLVAPLRVLVSMLALGASLPAISESVADRFRSMLDAAPLLFTRLN